MDASRYLKMYARRATSESRHIQDSLESSRGSSSHIRDSGPRGERREEAKIPGKARMTCVVLYLWRWLVDALAEFGSPNAIPIYQLAWPEAYLRAKRKKNLNIIELQSFFFLDTRNTDSNAST